MFFCCLYIIFMSTFLRIAWPFHIVLFLVRVYIYICILNLCVYVCVGVCVCMCAMHVSVFSMHISYLFIIYYPVCLHVCISVCMHMCVCSLMFVGRSTCWCMNNSVNVFRTAETLPFSQSTSTSISLWRNVCMERKRG